MCLNLVLLLVSVAILLLNGGHFAQEINFTSSPNPVITPARNVVICGICYFCLRRY